MYKTSHYLCPRCNQKSIELKEVSTANKYPLYRCYNYDQYSDLGKNGYAWASWNRNFLKYLKDDISKPHLKDTSEYKKNKSKYASNKRFNDYEFIASIEEEAKEKEYEDGFLDDTDYVMQNEIWIDMQIENAYREQKDNDLSSNEWEE